MRKEEKDDKQHFLQDIFCPIKDTLATYTFSSVKCSEVGTLRNKRTMMVLYRSPECYAVKDDNPTFQLVTPGAGPVLTPEASNEQTWLRSTRRCYTKNIKALGLPLSEKKNSEICLLCSYAPTCEPQGRTSPDPRGIVVNKLGRGPQGDATYKISKL